ncbi:MAG: histidine triad nucleotide-binding protein [Oscillospiraceae bacterium]|nr:histidine triad nucleotide-binding protein [Oscillospiraceae bacterium]
MENCIFCKIINGEIPSDKVYEDEHVYAFRDIEPQAPVHILIVPKDHVASVADISAENSHLAAKCLEAVGKIARIENLSGGYRVITNTGRDAGQTVFHLHFHLLGGAELPAMIVRGAG